MKVITTEENILEALDAAYLQGWEARNAWNAMGQAEVARPKPPQLTFEANLKLIEAVGRSVYANSQGMEAVSRIVDSMGWRHP